MNDGLKSVRNVRDDAVSRLDVEHLRALLAEYYRRQGYRVDAVETIPTSALETSGSDDGAMEAHIDLRLQRDDSRLLVRCLHWNDKQVPHQRVRAWQDLLADERADGAILATSGEFTPSAVRTASLSRTLRLVDGAELRKMLMPLLGDGEEAAFVDVQAFAAVEPAVSSPSAASATISSAVPGFEAGEKRSNENAPAPEPPPVALGDRDHDRDLDNDLASTHATIEDENSPAPVKARIKHMMWERGSRPASNMSIAVATLLLSLIVLTIVFRDRLDPYLGDFKPPVATAPRSESPLEGTDYKSDVFDPAIRAQKEPVGDAPKPQRPVSSRPESSQPTPDEAIRVIERNTPEMWEEQRRKAAADKAAADKGAADK